MVDKPQGPKGKHGPDEAADKRQAPRLGVLRQGQIAVDGRIIYCAVRDFSSTGARLQVGVDLPPSFDLLVDGRKKHLRAEVKWRRGDQTGVAFQEAPLTSAELDEVKPRQRLTPRRP